MIVNRRRTMGCIADDGYIHFEDPNVLQVLLNAGIGDGIGITIEDATSANLGTLFKNNSVIVSFDEFKYFTRPNTTVDFTNCSNLERIDLTNCTVMPKFSDCSSLAYFNGLNSVQGVMVIPEGITNLSNGTLARCAGITELHFPDSFTTFGSDSCRQMTNLTKIYLGSGIQTCSNSFYGDNALSEVHIPDIDTWLDIAFGNNDQSSPLTKAHHLYVDGVEVTSVDFTGRTTVGQNTLSGGTSITSVVLPSTITSISIRAFNGCSNLVIPDLNLPNLTVLGSYAFQGTKIQVVSRLGNITSIGANCFEKCTQLTSVAIPNTVTSIDSSAFSGCTSLTSITINAVTPPTLGSNAFKNTNNCPIYVPASSVSAYQVAWSDFASRIQAIPT